MNAHEMRRRAILSVGIALSLTAAPEAFAAEASGPDQAARARLSDLLARVAGNEGLAPARERLIAAARKDAAQPAILRPKSLQELKDSRIPLKYATRPPHFSALADRDWEIFCFSQGDNGAGALLKIELPRLAAAAALTHDPALLERTLAQLGELASWTPLERRGWSLGNGKPRFSGDDGAWLGTGWLIRAIADALEILPPDKVPQALRAAMAARLEAEITLMEEDWAQKRPWYFRREAPHSNQWILPNEALVRACLFLGADRHRGAYDRGIAHLLRSMDVQGADGAFVEGLRYSGLSLESLYSVARAAARSGDDRLGSHPFLRRFPTWLAHHFQPGGFLINAFDSPGSSRGNLARDQGLLATAALVTGSPHALWALRTRAGFPETLDGILAANIPATLASAPPLHACYTQAARLNWRSNWNDDRATGLWIRGGHATDFHDHMDRGHVNFIIGRRALLIEAGTLNYAVPNNATHMRSVAGHNVLQVGDAPPDGLTPDALKASGQLLDPEHRPAPIAVERMDGSGGAASVDMSKCYAAVAGWRRRVVWDLDSVAIEDVLELKEPGVAQFRWHLGAPAGAAATVAGGRVESGGILLTYACDQPVAARIEPMPDATIEPNKVADHACVVLKTAGPVSKVNLKTRVALAAQPR